MRTMKLKKINLAVIRVLSRTALHIMSKLLGDGR